MYKYFISFLILSLVACFWVSFTALLVPYVVMFAYTWRSLHFNFTFYTGHISP
jgi:hypothetical protein